MRVAFDVTSLLDPTTGVGAFAGQVARRLAGRDDVEVVGYSTSWRGRGRVATVAPPGMTMVGRPMAARPLRGLWLRTDHPVIERWTGPVDVVHGPNFVVPPARRAGQIVTVHDLTCLRYPDLVTADVARYPRLIQRALDRGAWVHTVSAFVADEVRRAFDIDPERVVTIPNGAPELVPERPGTDGAAGRALAETDRYVLALGTVEPRKDLPTLVRAFDRVAATDAALRLVIAGGDGWGRAVADLDDARRAAAHSNRIVRLGRVSDDHRAALFRGAAAFAYPSRYEGFGLPPLEAMAAGVPVVATHGGSLPEVIGDAGLLVPVGDADAMADALVEALDDDARRARLVAAGRANLTRFDWTRTVAQLTDLYRRAAPTQ